MRPPPVRPLAGGRFRLRPLRLDDADAWHAVLADPRVHGPTSWPLLDLPSLSARLPGYIARGTRWALARGDDDRLVGTCGAVRWDDETGLAEVAYELAPEYWGRGLATAAVVAFAEEARAAGIRTLEAHTWVDNVASARVLERTGFTRGARLPAFRDCRGELRDFWRWSRSLP